MNNTKGGGTPSTGQSISCMGQPSALLSRTFPTPAPSFGALLQAEASSPLWRDIGV